MLVGAAVVVLVVGILAGFVLGLLVGWAVREYGGLLEGSDW